jgi:hypothetical protein
MAKTRFEKHWQGRPHKAAYNVERWNGVSWIKDDGRVGHAFSGEMEGFPTHWYSGCDCMDDPNCPQRLAIDRTVKRFGCSNGSIMVQPHLKVVKE